MAMKSNKNAEQQKTNGRKAKVVPIDAPAKKPRGRNGAKTASIMDNTTARPEEIAQAVRNSFQYFNREIVKSDEECAERLNAYFQDCAEQQMLPTVENMSLALGTVRQVVWQWENGQGCSRARADMIKKAKQILGAIDADLVASGKVPQVVYIFRAKNFYGMSDQQEITINASNNAEQDMSAEDIAKRYIEDGKTVETTFAEDAER